MTPAALGEMIHFGFDPYRLDRMLWADLASWRRVMLAYHDAVERAARR
ncbi:MAG: hypothetical protein ACREFP_16745 [Acetobacteraceae bacterium]